MTTWLINVTPGPAGLLATAALAVLHVLRVLWAVVRVCGYCLGVVMFGDAVL